MGTVAPTTRARRAERGQLPPVGGPPTRPRALGLVDPAPHRRLLERRPHRGRPPARARRATTTSAVTEAVRCALTAGPPHPRIWPVRDSGDYATRRRELGRALC